MKKELEQDRKLILAAFDIIHRLFNVFFPRQTFAEERQLEGLQTHPGGLVTPKYRTIYHFLGLEVPKYQARVLFSGSRVRKANNGLVSAKEADLDAIILLYDGETLVQPDIALAFFRAQGLREFQGSYQHSHIHEVPISGQRSVSLKLDLTFPQLDRFCSPLKTTSLFLPRARDYPLPGFMREFLEDRGFVIIEHFNRSETRRVIDLTDDFLEHPELVSRIGFVIKHTLACRADGYTLTENTLATFATLVSDSPDKLIAGILVFLRKNQAAKPIEYYKQFVELDLDDDKDVSISFLSFFQEAFIAFFNIGERFYELLNHTLKLFIKKLQLSSKEDIYQNSILYLLQDLLQAELVNREQANKLLRELDVHMHAPAGVMNAIGHALEIYQPEQRTHLQIALIGPKKIIRDESEVVSKVRLTSKPTSSHRREPLADQDISVTPLAELSPHEWQEVRRGGKAHMPDWQDSAEISAGKNRFASLEIDVSDQRGGEVETMVSILSSPSVRHPSSKVRRRAKPEVSDRDISPQRPTRASTAHHPKDTPKQAEAKRSRSHNFHTLMRKKAAFKHKEEQDKIHHQQRQELAQVQPITGLARFFAIARGVRQMPSLRAYPFILSSCRWLIYAHAINTALHLKTPLQDLPFSPAFCSMLLGDFMVFTAAHINLSWRVSPYKRRDELEAALEQKASEFAKAVAENLTEEQLKASKEDLHNSGYMIFSALFMYALGVGENLPTEFFRLTYTALVTKFVAAFTSHLERTHVARTCRM